MAARLFPGSGRPGEPENYSDAVASAISNEGATVRRRPVPTIAYAGAVCVMLIGILGAAVAVGLATRHPGSDVVPAVDREIERVREELRALERQVENELRTLDEQLRAAHSRLGSETSPGRPATDAGSQEARPGVNSRTSPHRAPYQRPNL